jgi:hypothetical protein
MDVNVLVYAHREDAPDHARYRDWVKGVLDADSVFGVSELVLSGFLRIVTHPRVFVRPSPLELALGFASAMRSHPRAVVLAPGLRHWEIFQRLCEQGAARGNLVADAYHAALAIETGSTWVTTDRDFARFPGLQWRHPLQSV